MTSDFNDINQEKRNIGSLFDRIAGSYDRLNHLLSLNIDKLWRRKAVKGMKFAGSVLDVAIGTGDLSIEVMKQKKADSIIGVDLSTEMMRIGEDKVIDLGYSDQIKFVDGSALELPFDDESFDAVICAFGVRNFSDLEKGLSEMFRVLKKGGEVTILEFSYPDNKVISKLYDFYFSRILPSVGNAISKDKNAYSYLNKSVKEFVWGEAMKAKLEEAGFKYVGIQTLSLGVATVYRGGK